MANDSGASDLEEKAGILTERERQVIDLRERGMSYRDIARVLDLSVSTIVDTERRAARRVRRAAGETI